MIHKRQSKFFKRLMKTHQLSVMIKAKKEDTHGVGKDEGDIGWIQRRFFKLGDYFV